MQTDTQEVETPEKITHVELGSASFRTHLERALLCTQPLRTNGSPEPFSCVALFPSGEMVATDGTILYAGRLAPSLPVSGDFVLLHPTALKDLTKLLEKKAEYRVVLDLDTLTVTYRQYTVSLKAITQRFPRYEEAFAMEGKEIAPGEDLSEYGGDVLGKVGKMCDASHRVRIEARPPGEPTYYTIVGTVAGRGCFMPFERE